MPIKNNPIKAVWFDQATGGGTILAGSAFGQNYLVRISFWVHTAGAANIADNNGAIVSIAATAPVGSYASLGFGDGKAIKGDLVVNDAGRLSGTVEYYESV